MEDVYNKNYLKKVILRIDFPSTPLDIEENIPSSLLGIIIQKYPVFEVREKLEKQYKITFKTDSMDIDKSDIIKEFLYYTNDKKKSITVSVESQKYFAPARNLFRANNSYFLS